MVQKKNSIGIQNHLSNSGLAPAGTLVGWRRCGNYMRPEDWRSCWRGCRRRRRGSARVAVGSILYCATSVGEATSVIRRKVGLGAVPSAMRTVSSGAPLVPVPQFEPLDLSLSLSLLKIKNKKKIFESYINNWKKERCESWKFFYFYCSSRFCKATRTL